MTVPPQPINSNTDSTLPPIETDVPTNPAVPGASEVPQSREPQSREPEVRPTGITDPETNPPAAPEADDTQTTTVPAVE